MESIYMTTKEVAALFMRTTGTINKWGARNKKTGEKYMKYFPDQIFKSLYLRDEIMSFKNLSKKERQGGI